jgi:hypothetical protein
MPGLALLIAILVSALISATPVAAGKSCSCEGPDNGNGTANIPVTTPVSDCQYDNLQDVVTISQGFPPNAAIDSSLNLWNFSSVVTAPGGPLDGETVTFNAQIDMQMSGTGLLAGFQRFISVPVAGEIHLAPANPGSAVQRRDAELFALEGTIFGDPDFAVLRIRAGRNLGFPPSVGTTTLSRIGDPGTDFRVDSFFDVFVEINIVGAAGSALEGITGASNDRIILLTCACCQQADDNGGTIMQPGAACRFHNPDEPLVIRNGIGMPVGTTIEAALELSGLNTTALGGGGDLGGEFAVFEGTMTLRIEGTGLLIGFTRTINLFFDAEMHMAPLIRDDPVQAFDTELVSLVTNPIVGDPDFDSLSIVAGSANGQAAATGKTKLTRLGPIGTDFMVDSFFDIQYRIDFAGAPGSALEGLSGSNRDFSDSFTCNPSPNIFKHGYEGDPLQ